jgi:hypothetical protein
MKGYLDGDLHRDWFPVHQGRRELPALHSFDCLFIESHSKVACHPDMAGAAVGLNNHQKNASLGLFSKNTVDQN